MSNPNFLALAENNGAHNPILLQGGTRSGKTYAVLQFIIAFCYQYKNSKVVVSICRKTMPSIRATVMLDFLNLLKENEIYSEELHSKSNHTYELWGNTIEFINLDDEQKVRGRKRHMLYVNEANENSHDVIRQLLFRTSGLSIFDYNPSITEDHWLISDLLRRENAKRIITTYRDNPYLSKAQIEEIERLKSIDTELWKVFGLGEIGNGMRGQVFPNFGIDWKDDAGQTAYGLDFGYSPDPLALVECKILGNSLYLREHIYRNNMSAGEIVSAVKAVVVRGAHVVCDKREDIIKDLFNSGVNARSAVKGANSIDYGVKIMQGFNIFIHPESHNLIKEFKYYKYKEDKDGNPIGGAYTEVMNHAIDAARYAVTFMRNAPLPPKGFVKTVAKVAK